VTETGMNQSFTVAALACSEQIVSQELPVAVAHRMMAVADVTGWVVVLRVIPRFGGAQVTREMVFPTDITEGRLVRCNGGSS
jgi:hypothetical protein